MIKSIAAAITDNYERHARLYPTLFATLPVTSFAFALAPGLPGATKLGSVIVACGLPVACVNFGRYFGKRLEPGLYRKWGGRPTTILSRYKNAPNKQIVKLRHDLLQRVAGQSLTIPDEAAERRNISRADETYDAAVGLLREKTRNKVKFPLVYHELRDYGFRRNMLGLRPLALVVTVISLAAASIGLHAYITGSSFFISQPLLWAVAAVDIGIGLYFTLMVNEAWIKDIAYAYAERLLSSDL